MEVAHAPGGSTLLALVAALLPAQRGLVQRAGERWLALVIGNNAYPQARLVNAVPDARAMAGALGEVSFDISLLLDATREQMEDGAERFASSLQPGDVALVFYAGHRAELAGKNYLIPVDLSDRDVRGRAVRASFERTRQRKPSGAVAVVLLQ